VGPQLARIKHAIAATHELCKAAVIGFSGRKLLCGTGLRHSVEGSDRAPRMPDPPEGLDKVDEASDESFPAIDPPAVR
jgi:hypothetical protein